MFLLFSLTCSQIWLSPLLNGLQPTYLTNLTKKTHNFFLPLRANLHLRTFDDKCRQRLELDQLPG